VTDAAYFIKNVVSTVCDAVIKIGNEIVVFVKKIQKIFEIEAKIKPLEALTFWQISLLPLYGIKYP
jgi:hypothetical protein